MPVIINLSTEIVFSSNYTKQTTHLLPICKTLKNGCNMLVNDL